MPALSVCSTEPADCLPDQKDRGGMLSEIRWAKSVGNTTKTVLQATPVLAGHCSIGI